MEQNNNRNNRDNDFVKISLINQSVNTFQKRQCPLHDVPDSEIDYKNLTLLNNYIAERGKIIPARISGVSTRKQRLLAKAIKRARLLALLSFIDKVEDTNNK